MIIDLKEIGIREGEKLHEEMISSKSGHVQENVAMVIS